MIFLSLYFSSDRCLNEYGELKTFASLLSYWIEVDADDIKYARRELNRTSEYKTIEPIKQNKLKFVTLVAGER